MIYCSPPLPPPVSRARNASSAFLCGVVSSSPASPFTSFKFSPPILKVSIRIVVFLGNRWCFVCNCQARREDLLNANVGWVRYNLWPFLPLGKRQV